jgi:pimeloyl-ACP methyl ester carboxylesterase
VTTASTTSRARRNGRTQDGQRTTSRLGLAAVFVTAAGACSDAAAPYTGDTPWGPCPAGFRDECRTLALPLDYAHPDLGTVPVFISRAPSFAASHADLWLLQGGPGDSADVFDVNVDELRRDVPGVDIYTLEQRGIGQSARLGCPIQESASSDQGTNISQAELPACLAAVESQWPEGLANFRLTPTANDLAHAIDRTRTPGHDVFVYGVSYGTAVAIRYMQLRPNDAKGVILDSIAAAGIADFSHFSEQSDPVLHALADLCAADPGCVAHLGTDPWDALSKVTGEVADGHCPGAGFTRASLSGTIAGMLQSDALRVPAMALLHRIDRCNPDDLAAIKAYQQFAKAESSAPSDRYSPILYYNIVFNDLWGSPAPSLDTLQARCDALSICDEGSLALGEFRTSWPIFPLDPLSAQSPITTGSAVLLLNGTLDPQTPLANAIAFDDRLRSPHKTLVQVAFSAHATIEQALVTNPTQAPCGFQILESFVGNPNAPDTSCAMESKPVSFDSDPIESASVFGTPDFWDNDDAVDAGAGDGSPDGGAGDGSPDGGAGD